MPLTVHAVPAGRRPDYLINGGLTVAPGPGQVLVNSGPLAVLNPGSALWFVQANIASDDGVPDFVIVHRDAANSTDLELVMIDGSQANTTPGCYFKPGAANSPANSGGAGGELIVVRALTAGTTGKFYQASLAIWNA
jgi:hypothetical protein